MAEIKIKIRVPDWLYRYRWENIKSYVSWLMFPTKCSVCGNTVLYKRAEVNWKDEHGHTQMMGQADIEGDYSKCICTSCVTKAIRNGKFIPKRGGKSYQRFDVVNTCDHCQQKKVSYKWTAVEHNGARIGLILGNYCSWNSAHYCVDCIEKIFAEGEPRSGMYGTYKGKFVPLTNFRLPVVDGKVRFPGR